MDKPYKAEDFDATELTETIANVCNCAYAEGYNQALEDLQERIDEEYYDGGYGDYHEVAMIVKMIEQMKYSKYF